MKKDVLKIFSLILFFLIFLCLKFLNNSESDYKILKVTSVNEFFIDFNRNEKVDKNECVKLSDIETFSSIKTKSDEQNINTLGITNYDYLKLGLFSEEWTKANLTNKTVKVKFISVFPVKKVAIKYNNQDLAKYLLQNGLAYTSQNKILSQYENSSAIKKNSKRLDALEYYILNLKTNIYHSPNCKYAKNINHAQIFLKNNFNHIKYFPCKNCQKSLLQDDLIFDYTIPKNKKNYKKSFYKKFENFEIFFINPLESKKPASNSINVLSRRLIEEIDNANISIDLALYDFSNHENILNALIHAKNRGVNIRFVLDKTKNITDVNPLLSKIVNEFKPVFDNDNSLMHNKFFIFDNKKIFTGSTNISSSGIGGYNANISVIINSSDIAKMYTDEFEQMYSGKFSKDKKSHKTAEIMLDNIKIKPYFSPKHNILDDVLIPLIRNSKNEVFVSAFYLTDRKIISELIEAKNRGVNVFVLLDSLSAMNLNDRLILLRNAHIPVKAENWGGKNHEKTIMIDSNILVLGSCNFSVSGFNKNDENMLVINSFELANIYRDYYLYLFNSIDDKYFKHIPKAESLDSINSCYDGIDNDYDGKIDFADSSCIQKSK